jgi:hypothetical protein
MSTQRRSPAVKRRCLYEVCANAARAAGVDIQPVRAAEIVGRRERDGHAPLAIGHCFTDRY